MRRENRAPAVACMDQPKVLRQVLSRVCANVLDSTCVGRNGVGISRVVYWSRVPSRTITTRDSADSYFACDKRITRSIANYNRTNLHVRC